MVYFDLIFFMAPPLSPLRYPGGKGVLADYLAQLIEYNGVVNCTYAEPYAGGAGAALQLLMTGKVKRLLLNDADRSIWAFWKSIISNPEGFIELIEKTPITMKSWLIQRKIYRSPVGRAALELGFAAFFLNRCNRSGIIKNGGVIGGTEQQGKWKIDARFNKPGQIERIREIAKHADCIEVSNFDAMTFLRRRILSVRDRTRFFIYLDPPYYDKGSRLYLNYYGNNEHTELALFLRRVRNLKWLVSYDNVPAIRELYAWSHTIAFDLRYSASSSRLGSEIMIFSEEIRRPSENILLCSA